METFHRPHVDTLVERLDEPPHHIIAVFGPRQTGKTTIVAQALRRTARPAAHYRLDEPLAEEPMSSAAGNALRLPSAPRDVDWLARVWQQARHDADGHPRGFILVLDEIQTIPQWSSAVKGLWDADRAANRQLHVVILGSAPLLVQSGLTESLAGRFEAIDVRHWSFDEMADVFGMSQDEYIYFGGYPGAARFIRDELRWRDYVLRALVAPNIERDILAMTRVDKPALLKQLFNLGAAYSGQILSYNKMLGQLQDAGNATTLARYLDLLGTAGILAGLPKYAPSVHRARASSPKLNVLNTALMTAGAGYTFAQAVADRSFWGRVVESAVGAHILNTAPVDVQLHYWRDRGLEVDFVLRRGPRTVAIEVKSGQRRGQLPGLDAFAREFSPHRAMLVGEGGVPLDEFLATPAERWFDAS